MKILLTTLLVTAFFSAPLFADKLKDEVLKESQLIYRTMQSSEGNAQIKLHSFIEELSKRELSPALAAYILELRTIEHVHANGNLRGRQMMAQFIYRLEQQKK